MTHSLADLRRDYSSHELTESDVDPDPINQFRLWFQQAIEAEVKEPNGMALATATPDGKPSARIVLLKGVDERGFIFFTNYRSRKGEELLENPHAALVFWWQELERQVRIEGSIEKITDEESNVYFSSRPVGSRLGAWASEQSRVISSRDVLEKRLEELKMEYPDEEIPRPAHWGGYRLLPTSIEFWQGRTSRLHDRIHYRRGGNDLWEIERLSP